MLKANYQVIYFHLDTVSFKSKQSPEDYDENINSNDLKAEDLRYSNNTYKYYEENDNLNPSDGNNASNEDFNFSKASALKGEFDVLDNEIRNLHEKLRDILK